MSPQQQKGLIRPWQLRRHFTIFPFSKPCSWKQIVCFKRETIFRCLFSTKYFVPQTQVFSFWLQDHGPTPLPACHFTFKLSFQVPKNPLFCGLWQERLYHPSPCRIGDDPRQPTNSQLSKPAIFCSQRDVVKPGLFSSNAAKSCEMIYQTSNRIVTIGKKWTKDELQMFDYLRWSRMILKDHQ